MRLNRFGLRAALVAAMALASLAGAQRTPAVRLSVRDVGQIADAVLGELLPPDTSLSGVSVAKRGIAFNARGTLDAFGFKNLPDTALALTRNVVFATQSVTKDCSQVAPLPCAALGERAFVTISPVSVDAARVRIRVTVAWASPSDFHGDGNPTRRAWLSWYSATVYIVRSPDGGWFYAHQTPLFVVG